MATKVTLKLEGEHISLAELADAMSRTAKLLDELDATVSGRRTLGWDIGDLRKGSAVIDVIPRPLDPDGPDTGGAVAGLFYEGMGALQRSAERPAGYSDRALSLAKDLGDYPGDDSIRLTYAVLREGETASEPVRVTQRLSQNVDEILGPPRTSFGSVDGHLGRLDEWGSAFFILDRVTGRKIKCECDADMLDEIAQKYWKKNVVVTGEIVEDKEGKPKAIRAVGFRQLRERSELPQPEELLGLYCEPIDGR